MATKPIKPNANLGAPVNLADTGTQEVLAGLEVQNYGLGFPFLTEIIFRNFALSITDALAYSGQKIMTFPRGKIRVHGSASHLAFTTTSAIASTLNSGVTVQYGFGSATASAATLATTMIDYLAGSGQTVPTFASSTTINVASAAVTHHLLAIPAVPIDGSAAALAMYFNLAVGTATDIDADATLTVTGRVNILWSNEGGWAYYS